MVSDNSFILRATRNPRIPLALRRRLGKWFIPMDGRGFSVDIDGRRFEGQRDNYIEWVVYATGRHFEYTYINLVKSLVSGGVALDVGANVGNHTHAFAGFFDTVLSFEPLDAVARRLEATAAKLPNVCVHKVALGERNEALHFSPSGDANWGKGKIAADGELCVDVVAGDEYLQGCVSGPVNFIKIDVEGHELPVLRGLRNTLARDRPLVMFEAPRAIRKGPSGAVAALWEAFPDDYVFAALGNQSTLPTQIDTARVRPIDRHAPRLPSRTTYVLAWGPERGYRIKANGTLVRTNDY